MSMQTLRMKLTRPMFFLMGFIILAGACLQVAPVHAADKPAELKSPSFNEILSQGLLRAGSSDACKAKGQCSLTDILQVVINVMTFILGISGSIFLLMFVIGGFMWMTSGGNAANFQKGLDTIRDATIGLIVVFGAYLIVNSFLSLVRTGMLPGPDQDLNDTLNKVTDTKTIEIQ